MTSPPIWTSLTPEEHEFQYNPQNAVPDYERYRAHRAPANDAAKTLTRHESVAYGDHPLHTLDIYPAGDRAPVHLFLHGGYWRAQDKANFAFIAGTLVPRGITTVIANYELCPASTLDAVAASAIAAMDFIARKIGDFGGDPAAITLSGHSAGAHLGAEIIAYDWAREGFTAPVKGATLISGIYDPTPARLTTVNAELNLTEALIARRNVEARSPLLSCPVALFVGGKEPWHWIDQSYRYSHHLRRNGLDPAVHVLPGFNHFDILDEYLDADSLLVRSILGHAKRAKAAS
ncbi:alpha/beta hydrolase [Acuticoccus sp. M5D2P5]|uniref:alpha/beta hydrolase n=1 Tax=Acuticoccus kalidii TaxID=2910977 RepID=UPI001F188A89|nr:alpha/beta hydrolase [Acuticoccus kalidii]MCF3936198.1 alpha/beta hydrolase [Acuticoccus kalidii]